MDAIKDFSAYAGMISNSGHDERGRYSGGAAGDQTGTEWQIRAWYSRPWDCVIRFNDRQVAAMMATLSIYAAQNSRIGYDQGQRTTYWQALEAANYDPRRISRDCEADCSSGVLANVRAALILTGHPAAASKININGYTGNLKNILRSTGLVTVYTMPKYIRQQTYLQAGDILLNEAHHVAVYVGGGTVKKTSSGKVADRFDRDIAGTYTVTASSLNLRNTAGDGTIITAMPRGSKVQNYGYYTVVSGTKWLYVVYSGKTGFCSAQYLHR